MKLKAALVSYLNTKPFIQGIEKHFSPNELQLDLRAPSQCAEALRNRECDLALVPAGAIRGLRGVSIMKDHCIGATGNVGSVLLLSNSPLKEIHTLIPDADSRTSNLLARVLAAGFWKQNFHWEEPQEFGASNTSLPPGVGRISIGDKAMQMKKHFTLSLDLAGEWNLWTGLPFVFAVWAYYPENVSRVALDKFRVALQEGIEDLHHAAEQYGPEFGLTPKEAYEYFSRNLWYRFDSRLHEAFQRFMQESQSVLAGKVGESLRA